MIFTILAMADLCSDLDGLLPVLLDQPGIPSN
jgi:hypothetical protein